MVIKIKHSFILGFSLPKIEDDNGSLECAWDIEKLLESENIYKAISMQMALQMMI